MYTKSRRLRYTSLWLVISLCLGLPASPAAAGNVPGGEGTQILSGYDRNNSYGNYIAKYKNEKAPDVELKIPASSIAASRGNDARVSDYKDAKNVLDWKIDQAGSWVEWDVTIPQTGLYQMAANALIPQSNPRDMEFGLQIDGKTPFNEAEHQVMSRVWMDDGGIQQSSAGHDIRPKPIVAEKWMDYGLRDSEGRYGDDFQFYFTQGTHKIRLASDNGELLLQFLKIYRMPAVPDYKQMAAIYKEKGYKPAINQFIKVQAENSDSKSSSDLSPIFDRSSSATEPYDAYKIKLNTIGGPNWKRPGQWISWKLDVPESGLYQLAIKYRQNLLNGLFTSRRIYIDGKVPFREWEHVRFPFGNGWGMKVPGDKEPEFVYLEKGKHELKMEAVLGEISDSINEIDGAIYELNDLYRRIIMITSTHPDPYRDYYIDERVPDMVKLLQDNGRRLADQADRLAEVSGEKGSEVALLETISYQLADIANQPATIATRLDSFKSNVSALASWSARVKEQPLELDYIELLSPDQKLQSANESFPRKIWRMVNQFIASFVVDYDAIGNKDAKAKSSVKVWVGAGRDQASILKNLIDNYFTPQTGISVDLQLVQGSIIEATLAGKGPDIALMQPNGEPVNFALRGALVDLSKFRDFGEVSKRFYNSALVPFQFMNGYYGIPETQAYDMMFYRKDVLGQLGLKVPDTWDDFYKMIPVITRNNMNVGFNQDMFATFLFQRGGTYYNKSLTRTAFDTPEAQQAFADLTNMYTRYDFPLAYDFYSRFRTGEMPIAFQPFTQFNLLSVASPELNGLWDMAPYPGFKRPDGSIDRSQHATSTASIMFTKTKDKDAAWEFMKWWSTADIQAKYGKDLEILMGPAARYPTANIEAFKQLPWAQKERDNIMKQWEHVKGIPEAPGSYYTGVGLTNAFRAATVDYNKDEVPANPYQALSEWNHMINDELKRKRIEFGLPAE